MAGWNVKTEDVKMDHSKPPFPLAPGEQLRVCKYDKSHQILKSKYSLHLRKCRQGYIKRQQERGLPIEIEVCMYNYLHHVSSANMPKHLTETCRTALKNGLIKPQPRAPIPRFDDSDSDCED